MKSKFTSTFVKHTLYDSKLLELNFIEEDSSIEEDPSASDVPDSIEFKSIQSEGGEVYDRTSRHIPPQVHLQ